MNAAKLIRTCRAMRVRSGRTSTGPHARTAARTAAKVSRTTGAQPAKCASTEPSGAQVWVWLRFAKVRPQPVQVHIGSPSRTPLTFRSRLGRSGERKP